MLLLLQIAVVLAAARVARWAIVPFRQPAVIGEMIAGLLLGPSLFGWLMPGASAALFATPSLPALNALSQIGLVLFMFFVGVRVDVHKVGNRRRVAMATSAISIIVPFVLGAWLASAVHARLAPAGVGLLPFTLFFGAAMSITAFPVLARILIDLGMLRTELGAVAIACAAFDDVMGWLILAVITALARSDGLSTVLAFRLLFFFGYLAAMAVVVRPALRWFVRRRGLQFGSSADDLVAVLLVVLVSAVITEALGIHALFGAFFVGLMMPRDAHIERVFEDRLEPLTLTLLLPLFFAFTGLRTNVQLIGTAAMWKDAALIFLVAVAGKAGASTLAARMMGLGWRDASTLGFLLNTRGLIELVVLNIGLELGILSPVVFSMLVLMALATTFMTSPIVRGLRAQSPDTAARWKVVS